MAARRTIDKKTEKMIEQLVEAVKYQREYNDDERNLYFYFETILSECESRYPKIKYSTKMGDGKLDIHSNTYIGKTFSKGEEYTDYKLSMVYVPKGYYRTSYCPRVEIELSHGLSYRPDDVPQLYMVPGPTGGEKKYPLDNYEGRIPKSSK